jgi:hypothetical protein
MKDRHPQQEYLGVSKLYLQNPQLLENNLIYLSWLQLSSNLLIDLGAIWDYDIKLQQRYLHQYLTSTAQQHIVKKPGTWRRELYHWLGPIEVLPISHTSHFVIFRHLVYSFLTSQLPLRQCLVCVAGIKTIRMR